MNPTVQTILNTLQLDDDLFQKGIASLDDKTARKRIVDNANPIIWLAGHLLNSRMYLLNLLGDDTTLPWVPLFRDGYDENADLPSIAELSDAWQGVAEAIYPRLTKLTEQDLARPIDWNLPNRDKTVRGAFLFYTYHEAWHLGQIAYARKGNGMEGLVPY